MADYTQHGDPCAVQGCDKVHTMHQAFLLGSELLAVPVCTDHYGMRDCMEREA